MNLLRALVVHRRMMAAQWLDPARLRSLRERKLALLLRGAYDNVPYYRRLFDEARLRPDDVRSTDDLVRLPVTTKAQLQQLPLDALLDRRAPRRSLRSERSSGSTGRPFEVFYDAAFHTTRRLLFLRGLRAAGYRPGERVLLVTAPGSGRRSRPLPGWHYLSFHEPPERLAERFARLRPHRLYGCVTPLRLMAEQLGGRQRTGWTPRGVVTTAETLDKPTRTLLEEAFRCPVFDFYGLTEMGLVASECARRQGRHVAEDVFVVEEVPVESGEGLRRLVVTNLESRAMPFIRFDTGDAGRLAPAERCSCGRTFTLLARVEGRVADCVRLMDGRIVAPYALTCALEAVAGLHRFRIVQRDRDRFLVEVQRTRAAGTAGDEDIRGALRRVLGPEAAIDVASAEKLDPPPGKKFRVVQSELAEGRP